MYITPEAYLDPAVNGRKFPPLSCFPRSTNAEKNIQISKDDYYDALSQSSKGWKESENDDTPFIKCILGVGWLYRDFEDCVDMVGTKMRQEKCLKKQ